MACPYCLHVSCGNAKQPRDRGTRNSSRRYSRCHGDVLTTFSALSARCEHAGPPKPQFSVYRSEFYVLILRETIRLAESANACELCAGGRGERVCGTQR